MSTRSGKSLGNGQKLVRILRLRGIMRGIAPGIRENSGWDRVEAWQSPGLCMEESTTVNWWPGERDGENESPVLSLILISHSPIAWTHGKSQRTREPSSFSTYGSSQGSRRTNRGSPRLLSHSQSSSDLRLECRSSYLYSSPLLRLHTPSTNAFKCRYSRCLCEKHHSHHVNSILWNSCNLRLRPVALPLHCMLNCVD